MLKKFAIGLGIFVVLLVIGIFVVPSLIPTAAYKQQLLDRFAAATGRTARIDGQFGFTILPQLSLFANKVAVANAPGAGSENIVTIDRLSLRVALMPLLSGRVAVQSFVLDKPVINLSVDKSGRPNWRFAGPSARPAATARPGGAGGSGRIGPLNELTLGAVRIIDGKLTFVDARTGTRAASTAVDLTLSLPSLHGPMAADGSLVWHGEKVALLLQAADPGALLAGRPAAVNGEVTTKSLHAAFNGKLDAGNPVTADGTLAVDGSSLSRVAAWIGGGQPSGPALGRFALRGDATLAGPAITLRHLQVSLDALKGDGEMRLDDAGARPHITAKLTLGKVNLDPYLPPPSPAPAPAAAGHPSPPAPAASASASASASAPRNGQVSGGFAALKRVDGSFDLTLAGLAIGRWAVGPSHLSISLNDGRLTSNIDRMALYAGGAKGTMTLDATAVPRITLSCQLSGVQLKSLFDGTGDTEPLEGRASLDLQATGDGSSRRAILSSLAGSGRFDVRDGALHGVDLGKLMRSAAGALDNPSAADLGAVTGRAEKTAFSQLTGSYTIRDGILINKDLAARGSLFAASGQGRANLVDRTLDYRLDVKLYSPQKIRIGGLTMSELTIPIVVTGPWDAPSYRPDLAAALRGIAKGKVLRELEKRIPGVKSEGGLGKLLQNLPAGSGKPNTAGNVLRQLFGH